MRMWIRLALVWGLLLVGTAASAQTPVSQSGTWTVQPGNTANSTAWLVTGTGGAFPSTQSGTWTVQPGNTANTTAWLVTGLGGTFPATQSGTWNIGTVTAVTAISNALPAGTNAIGKLAANSGVDIGDVDVTSIAAGDNNIGNMDVASIAAGDNNIGNVDIVTVIPGTAATNLGKAEDAAHTTGDTGVVVFGVRQDTQSDFGADGDYTPLSIDDAGNLRITGAITGTVTASISNGSTTVTDDDVIDGDQASVAATVAVNYAQAASFGATPTAQTVGTRVVNPATVAGVPFVHNGHPNIKSATYYSTGAITDDNVLAAIAGGTKYVVVGFVIKLSSATQVSPSVTLGFGTSTLPAVPSTNADGVDDIIFYDPAMVPGSGIAQDGLYLAGADGAEVRVTLTAPTSGAWVITIRYFTIAS